MKKISCFVLFISFVLLPFFGNAKENKESLPPLSVSALWQNEHSMAGGSVEFGIPIYQEEDSFFLVRNYILLSGMGGNKNGRSDISDKVIIGSLIPCNSFSISAYGFLEGGFSLFTTVGKKLLSSPFIVQTKIGGGFEFHFTSSSSFLVEYGGSFPFIVGKDKESFKDMIHPSPLLTLGYRCYF